jgi:hypothetical protein
MLVSACAAVSSILSRDLCLTSTASATRAPRTLRQAALLLLLAVVVAAPLEYIHIVNRSIPSARTGLLPRWIGTRAALHGQDPYSREVLRMIQTAFYGHPLAPGAPDNPENFLYPATVIPLLAPLAPLSWPTARLVFLAVNIPLLALGFWLCFRTLPLRWTPRARIITLLLALAAWPTMWGFRVLQLTVPVAACIFVAWYLLARKHPVPAGILLALATIKPQLLLPLLLALFVWALLQRQWALTVSFLVTMAVQLVVSQALVPGWFPRWRASLRNYTGVTKTAMPLEHLFGHWPGLAITLALAAAALVALWRARGSAAESPDFPRALSLVLAVTVCFVPTSDALLYNYVLLTPACVLLVFSRPHELFASLLRLLALVQLGFDYFSVTLGGIMGLIGHVPGFVAALSFTDYLLPPLAALALTLQMIESQQSVGLSRGTASTQPRLVD